MNQVIRFFLPSGNEGKAYASLVLALRVLFGGLLLSHGLQKRASFDTLSGVFPDPLGVGSEWSLALAVFAEAIGSILFIVGFAYRLVLLPMIFTMGVAFFVIHGGDPFGVKELAFVYLAVFVVLYVAGVGRYSVDYWIGRRLGRNK